MNKPTFTCASLAWYVNVLQRKTFYDMIQEYPTSKGGTDDRYGRPLNSRGGGTEAEKTSRYCQATPTRWQDTRLHNRGILAREAARPGAVYRGSEVHQEEELISVSSAATQRTAIAWNPLTERCRVSLPCVHYSNESSRIATNHHTKQRYDGYGVVGGAL
jgi:hypothetical protein